MNSADEALRKYEHQLQMLRGTSIDTRSKFERDLETLKIAAKDSRAKYFEMEEKRGKFLSIRKPVSGFKSSDIDDHFIRDSNVRNIEMLREADRNLGDIMEMGVQAHENVRDANQDLIKQRHVLLTLFYYDEDLKVYIDKATNKVSYLERKTYVKKILLVCLMVLLGILLAVSIVLKMFG